MLIFVITLHPEVSVNNFESVATLWQLTVLVLDALNSLDQLLDDSLLYSDTHWAILCSSVVSY